MYGVGGGDQLIPRRTVRGRTRGSCDRAYTTARPPRALSSAVTTAAAHASGRRHQPCVGQSVHRPTEAHYQPQQVSGFMQMPKLGRRLAQRHMRRGQPRRQPRRGGGQGAHPCRQGGHLPLKGPNSSDFSKERLLSAHHLCTDGGREARRGGLRGSQRSGYRTTADGVANVRGGGKVGGDKGAEGLIRLKLSQQVVQAPIFGSVAVGDSDSGRRQTASCGRRAAASHGRQAG